MILTGVNAHFFAKIMLKYLFLSPRKICIRQHLSLRIVWQPGVSQRLATVEVRNLSSLCEIE